VPEQQPVPDPRRRFCNTFNQCPQFRDLEAENAWLREALAELVRLKDGPRDDAYRAAKDAAWQAARDALGGDRA
jgi:hypothetical protein